MPEAAAPVKALPMCRYIQSARAVSELSQPSQDSPQKTSRNDNAGKEIGRPDAKHLIREKEAKRKQDERAQSPDQAGRTHYAL